MASRKAAELEQIADDLNLLLDNPDDAGLDLGRESELRNIIGMVRATKEELTKFLGRT